MKKHVKKWLNQPYRISQLVATLGVMAGWMFCNFIFRMPTFRYVDIVGFMFAFGYVSGYKRGDEDTVNRLAKNLASEVEIRKIVNRAKELLAKQPETKEPEN